MPLVYGTTQPINLPDDVYNADGVAVLIAQGARYGGHWVITLIDGSHPPVADEPILGEIETVPHDSPDMAFDTTLVWVNDYAARTGVKLAHAENLSGQYPPDQRPFFMLGQFALDRGAPS